MSVGNCPGESAAQKYTAFSNSKAVASIHWGINPPPVNCKAVLEGRGFTPIFLMKREWRAATLAKLGVTGVGPAVVAGGGIHFVISQLSRALGGPPGPLETRKQPQNLTALAVDRSRHLVQKYRLTYHRQ
jgi:hypothetical protein